MDICAQCEHFKIKTRAYESDEPIADYQMFCKHDAVEHPLLTNPQTGVKGYRGKDEHGRTIFNAHKEPYARDINPLGVCSALAIEKATSSHE